MKDKGIVTAPPAVDLTIGLDDKWPIDDGRLMISGTQTAALIPSFYPADPGEILQFGLLAYELSRYSGLSVGLKLVNELAEQTVTANVALSSFDPVLPPYGELPPEGAYSRWSPRWAWAGPSCRGPSPRTTPESFHTRTSMRLPSCSPARNWNKACEMRSRTAPGSNSISRRQWQVESS